MPFFNLEKLPAVLQNKIFSYFKSYVDIHGDNIVSVLIYGSATGTNFNFKKSDINSVIIFKVISFETLKKSLLLCRRGIRQSFSVPLFLTESNIRSSLDVFPIEYEEIKENHVLIYGQDVFSVLNVPLENIRLLCEFQIKSKLIRLRESYLEIGSNPKLIKRLLRSALNSLIPVFKRLLTLRKMQSSLHKKEMLLAIGQEFGLDAQIFLTVLDDKYQSQRDVEDVFKKFLSETENLTRILN